jgi:hypothetical protein
MEQKRGANYIDGVWPLEGFLTQKNAAASIRIGYIGIGQAGGKMVDAFASIRSAKDGEPIYQCMIINSNLGDMRTLKNIPEHLKFRLKGFESGVGKNPEVGKQALIQNGAEIFDSISTVMEGCQMIYVVAGGGGGTGSGSINVLVDAISDYLAIPVAAIVALPRPDEVESLNAYNTMAELVPKLKEFRTAEGGDSYRVLENLILLDNEKIVLDHLSDPEVNNLTWDFYSNYKVAGILHEWNVVTSLESHITLDAADLMNHVFRTGGVLTFAKKRINLDEIRSKEDLIHQIIDTYKGKNVLANGFNYAQDMRSMGLIVVMPRDRMDMLNQDTLELIRTKMKQELPDISFYPGFASSSSQRHAIVYTISSMSGLPERARNLRKEAEDLHKSRLEKESKASGFDIGEKLSLNQNVSSTITNRRSGAKNPFATNAQKQGSESNQQTGKPRNPFEKK